MRPKGPSPESLKWSRGDGGKGLPGWRRQGRWVHRSPGALRLLVPSLASRETGIHLSFPVCASWVPCTPFPEPPPTPPLPCPGGRQSPVGGWSHAQPPRTSSGPGKHPQEGVRGERAGRRLPEAAGPGRGSPGGPLGAGRTRVPGAGAGS